MSNIKSIVEDAINGNKVTVFSKSWCPYCKRAKNLLTSKYPDAQVQILELDERDDGSAIQNYLLEKTGQSSVPNIFVGQKHVGGSDDLHALDRVGSLGKLIAAV